MPRSNLSSRFSVVKTGISFGPQRPQQWLSVMYLLSGSKRSGDWLGETSRTWEWLRACWTSMSRVGSRAISPWLHSECLPSWFFWQRANQRAANSCVGSDSVLFSILLDSYSSFSFPPCVASEGSCSSVGIAKRWGNFQAGQSCSRRRLW